jgi:hypothetical protein
MFTKQHEVLQQREMRAAMSTIRSAQTKFEETIKDRISRREEIVLANSYHRVQNFQEELASMYKRRRRWEKPHGVSSK